MIRYFLAALLFAGPAFGQSVTQPQIPPGTPGNLASFCAGGVVCDSQTALALPQNFWLSSHFEGNTGTNLYISTSTDGITWSGLLKQSLYSATGGYVVHDPVMTYWQGTYYVAYLNKTISATSTFGLVSSVDLIHWTFVQNVPVPIPGATANEVVWSPFWFIDTDNSLHVILGASPDCGGTTCNGNAQGMNLYEIHPVVASSLGGSWSTPVLITGTNIPTSSGTTPGIFNPALVKVGNTYNLFYNNGQNSYYNEWASSTSLTSGYSTVATGNWAGWQNNPAAVPQGLNLIHVGTNHWRAYLDTEGIGTEAYSDCMSENWLSCTWTTLTGLTFADGQYTSQGTYALFSGSVPPTALVQASSTYGLQQPPGGPVNLQNKLYFGTTFDGGSGWGGNRTAFYMNDGTTQSTWNMVNGLYMGTANSKPVNILVNNVTQMTLNPNGSINIPFGPIIIPQTTPASSAATCTTGAIYADANYLYACTATNTWKRAALSAF